MRQAKRYLSGYAKAYSRPLLTLLAFTLLHLCGCSLSEKIPGKNTIAGTSFLKFSQPAAGEKNFGKNTVAETSFPDEERKQSLRKKNWKFNFFFKN